MELTADCTQCAALCCVAMAFDKGDMFGCDKAAGEQCLHLDEGHGCSIHVALEDEGFAGCVRYDCLGAGQRVVQEMFDGGSWREGADVGRDMFEAFRLMRLIHGWLELLETAAELPLNVVQEAGLEALYVRLKLPEGYDLDTLVTLEKSGIGVEIGSYLRSLADTVRR